MKSTLKRLSWNSSQDTLQLPHPGSGSNHAAWPASIDGAQQQQQWHRAPSQPNSPLSTGPRTHAHQLDPESTSPPHSPALSDNSARTYDTSSRPSSTKQPKVDRATLLKSVSALNELKNAVEGYKDSVALQFKAQENLVHAMKSFAGCFAGKVQSDARSEVVVMALKAAARLVDALGQVDGAHVKAVKNLVEPFSEHTDKFVRKVEKEERAFDEALAALDNRLNKTSANYEKTRPAGTPRTPNEIRKGAEQHDKYIRTMADLSASIAAIKDAHSLSMGRRREQIAREAGRVMCAVSEAGWRAKVDGARKGGDKVGVVIDKGMWCDAGMQDAGYFDDECDVEVRRSEQPPQDSSSFSSPPRQTGLRGPRPPVSTDQTRSSGHTSERPATSSQRTLYESSLNSMSSASASARSSDSTRMTNSYATLPVQSQFKTSLDLADPDVELRSITQPQQQVTRPSPRYPSAPAAAVSATATGSATVTRSDTTASEQSFVAKMRAVYAEQKARQTQSQNQNQERQVAPGAIQQASPTPFVLLGFVDVNCITTGPSKLWTGEVVFSRFAIGETLQFACRAFTRLDYTYIKRATTNWTLSTSTHDFVESCRSAKYLARQVRRL
ncbi:hypothetical protein ACM66B_006602 [Microbotryomycetes sp. NB124-2]